MAPAKKIGSRPTTDEDTQPVAEQPKKGKSVLIGAGVALAAVAGYWFLLGPGAAKEDAASEEETAAVEEEVELGSVEVIDAISVNLTGGNYLRLGLGLQLSADAGGHGEFSTAAALDAAIALYSGQAKTDLADPTVREELKHELVSELEELYHGDVVDVYYTDFVTQ